MSDKVSVGKKLCVLTIFNAAQSLLFDDIEEVDIIYLFIYKFMAPNTRNSQSLRNPDTVKIARYF